MGDIVFCRVGGSFYVHAIESIVVKLGGCRYQICNNRGHTNGVVSVENVFGKVVRVET